MYFIEFYYQDKFYYFYFEESVPVEASKKSMCLDLIIYETKRFAGKDLDRMKELLENLDDDNICETDTQVFKGIFNMLENPIQQGFIGFLLEEEDSEKVLITLNLDENKMYNSDFEFSIMG